MSRKGPDPAPGGTRVTPERTEEILEGFTSWLDTTRPTATHRVVDHQVPSAGYSSTTLVVQVERTEAGPVHRDRLVLRLPPDGPGVFDGYDLTMQAQAQNALGAAGIPTARPAVAEEDTTFTGCGFMVMPAVQGSIIGEVPALDPRLRGASPSANEAFHVRFLDLVAAINRVEPTAVGLDGVVPLRDNSAELAHWRRYLDWYADGAEPVPALTRALEACESHQPADEPPPSLLWGDVRIGNVVLDDQLACAAVLDWEMATIGAAEHDLAWMLTLDATQATLLSRTVPGFLDRDACVARYEQALGRTTRDLWWYELLACVRSTAIMSRIAYLNDRRGEPNFYPLADNPVVELLERRVAALG